MLAACKRDYNRVFIQLLLKTGLRDGEAQHLCWSDVSSPEKKLRVRSKPEYGWKIKDYEQRDIPLSANLLRVLKAWQKTNSKKKLVLGTVNDQPNTKLLSALKGIAKNAKVPGATLHGYLFHQAPVSPPQGSSASFPMLPGARFSCLGCLTDLGMIEQITVQVCIGGVSCSVNQQRIKRSVRHTSTYEVRLGTGRRCI